MVKNNWLLALICVVGAVVGSVVNQLCTGHVPGYLTRQVVLGLDSPLKLNLAVVHIQFGFLFEVSACTVLGLGLGVLIFRKL